MPQIELSDSLQQTNNPDSAVVQRTAQSTTSPAIGDTPPAHSKWPVVLIALVIIVTFARLLGSEFTWWDDQETIHHNPALNPPTLAAVADYWKRPYMGLYFPVTMTVWAAIAKVAYVPEPDEWGIYLNPWLFHAANLLLHVGSSIFVYRILQRLLGATSPALAGALLFAVHPMQVESVAWLSGMKDLLCWFGTIAACWMYLRRVQAVPADRPLWASWELPAALGAMLLAVLSKPTAMVAPAAMLAIGVLAVSRRPLRAALELLPFFALSIATAVMARIAQYVPDSVYVTPWKRPFVVADTLIFYARKFVWPHPLSIDYGRRPSVILADASTYVQWLLPAAAAVIFLCAWRRQPLITLAGALIIIGIAPVSGVTPFQMQQYSTPTDHYVYFSLIGVSLLVGLAFRRWPRRWMAGVVAAVLVAFAARAADQTKVWADSFSVLFHASDVNPRSWAALNNIASGYLNQLHPDPEKALPFAKRAVEMEPAGYITRQNLGVSQALLGDAAGAADTFEDAWRICSENNYGPVAKVRLTNIASSIFYQIGQYDRSIEWAERGLSIWPDDSHSIRVLMGVRKHVGPEADVKAEQASGTTTPADAATGAAGAKPAATTAPVPVPASAPSR